MRALIEDDRLAPYRVPEDGPFGHAEAFHLLQRAGMGEPPARVEETAALGLDAAVDRILSPCADAEGLAWKELLSASERIALVEDREAAEAWWIRRMIAAPRPLLEHLALFWHDHFACSDAKVKDLAAMVRQNLLFLARGTGTFAELLPAVMSDPALLFFLDGNDNTRLRPNENLGREILEMFTLGRGNYSESDVRAAARALTGWHVVGRSFKEVAEHHDAGEKAILGRQGRLGARDLFAVCLAHPALPRFIAGKLAAFFVGPPSDDGMAQSLGEAFKADGLDVAKFLRRLFRSRLFFTSRGRLVKSPVELIVGTMRLLGGRADGFQLARTAAKMGEELFMPPSVAGWNRGPAWLSTSAFVLRQAFAAEVARGGGTLRFQASLGGEDAVALHRRLLGREPDRRTLEWIRGAGEKQSAILERIMLLPEYQVS